MSSSGAEDMWEDDQFPANSKSLGEVGGDSANASGGKTGSGVEFPSPNPFGPFDGDDVMVFDDDIDPNDVNQGSLGDCWFLAAISGLAEDPDRIRLNFIDEEVTDDHSYRIKLFKHGVEQEVTVNAHFPTIENGARFAFSKAKGAEIWVPLLEKAYSKVHGSYAAIEGGQTAVGFFDLSGAPGFNLDLDDVDEEELWDRMVEWDEAGHLMGCGPDHAALGLHTGHAYTVLGVCKLSNGTRLVKLRNPWGAGEWTGDWSDHSTLWNSTFEEEAGQEDAEDGLFFMSLQDYKRYIGNMSCNVWLDEHKLHSSADLIAATDNSGHCLVKVEVEDHDEGELVFCTPVYDVRGQAKNTEELEYSFTVLNDEGQVLEESGWLRGYVPWNFVPNKHEVEGDDATFYVFVKWNDPNPELNLHREIRAAVYCHEDSDVTLTPLEASEADIAAVCAKGMMENLKEEDADEQQYWTERCNEDRTQTLYTGKGDWAFKLEFAAPTNCDLLIVGKDSQGAAWIVPGEDTLVAFIPKGVQWQAGGWSSQGVGKGDVPSDVTFDVEGAELGDFDELDADVDVDAIPPYSNGISNGYGAQAGYNAKKDNKEKEQRAADARTKKVGGCFSWCKKKKEQPREFSKRNPLGKSNKGKAKKKKAPVESSEEESTE